MSKVKTTGEMLKELRGDKTQDTVASEIGIKTSSWAMYERDERIPRDEIKVKIARYFNKSIQELFFDPIEHYMCT